MPYIINNSDNSLSVTVQDQVVDTTNYSLALVGRQVSNYGQYFAQNTLRHLENFASVSAPNPATKLIGQIWYDKTENLIKVYDGVGWKRATNIVVGSESDRPNTADAGEHIVAGTTFFNTTNNKLEVYNGSVFKDAGYPGEITSAYSSDSTVDNPTFYGTRLRTLFLKDSAGVVRPVLAVCYVKSTAQSSANRGTTQVGDQYETIMSLFSDEEFVIGTDTETPVDGVNINYYNELTQSGVGIATARSGRIAGQILKGQNLRAEYEASSVTSVTTLFADTIGSASQPVSTMHVNELSVANDFTFSSGTVSNDFAIGGDLTLTAGDINASSGIGTFANLVVTANTTLSGHTTINGNLTLNGVNTQSLGTDAEKVETIFGDAIDTQSIVVDGTATIATGALTDLAVSGTTTLNSLSVTSGSVTLSNTTVQRLVVDSVADFNSTLNVDGTSVFQSDVTVAGSSDIILGTGVLQGAATEGFVTANANEATSMFITFVDGASGKQELESHSVLRYNPSTEELSATGFTGWSNQLKTQSRSTNASHYLTFVNSNNGTAGAETFYTDAGVSYNPSTNKLNVSGNFQGGGTGVFAGAGTFGGTGQFGGSVTLTTGDLVLTTGDVNASAGTVYFSALSDGSITPTGFTNTVTSSNTIIPTSGAVKTYTDTANTNMQAYVDALVTAQDLDFKGDTGGNLNIDLDSERLHISGGTNLNSVGSGNTVTVNLDSALTGLTSISTGSLTATGSISDGTATLNGGGLTGVTSISASGTISAATISGTNLSATSNVSATNLNLTGSAYIDGDLVVEGSTTTISTTNTVIEDQLVELNTGQTGTPSGDIGHIFERGNQNNVFIGWDESVDAFRLGTGTFTGANTGNLTFSSNANLIANDIDMSGDLNVGGNLTVNGASGSVANWNTAYGWGDHGVAGYITSVTAGTDCTGGGTSGAVTINVTATSANTANRIVKRDGSGNFSAGVITATATSARYADLAEIYSADADYEAGTVVKLGGSEEITMTTAHSDTEVFGVISTDPAFLMNKDAQGLPVALTGRVPVKVIGTINKGDRLVSSDVPGVARSIGSDTYDARAVIGRALQNKDSGAESIIEAVIGVK